jgi:hypothetical protein
MLWSSQTQSNASDADQGAPIIFCSKKVPSDPHPSITTSPELRKYTFFFRFYFAQLVFYFRSLCNQLDNTTGLLDLSLGLLAEISCSYNHGDLWESALAKNL